MSSYPDIPTVGAFVYLAEPLAERPELLRTALRTVLTAVGIDERDVKMNLYRRPFKRGRWRSLSWKVIDEAIASADALVMNLLVGTPQDVRFGGHVALRPQSEPPDPHDGPLDFSFVCESKSWPGGAIASAGRRLCELAAELGGPLSGGVFRTPILIRALGEIDQRISIHGEPDRYPMPSRDWPMDRWEKARRLYPITLLGPKLASQVSAADATAAGALAVQEINGSLLIDAYPEVVETWDPEFLRATVELRRWLWPHTIQNAADAAGLGLKLRR
jgi:hypothetical protein